MENCSAMTEMLPISRLRQSRRHKLNLNPFTVYSLVDAQRYLEKNSRFLSILHPWIVSGLVNRVSPFLLFLKGCAG